MMNQNPLRRRFRGPLVAGLLVVAAVSPRLCFQTDATAPRGLPAAFPAAFNQFIHFAGNTAAPRWVGSDASGVRRLSTQYGQSRRTRADDKRAVEQCLGAQRRIARSKAQVDSLAGAGIGK